MNLISSNQLAMFITIIFTIVMVLNMINKMSCVRVPNKEQYSTGIEIPQISTEWDEFLKTYLY